ncbi:hypothetical protein [Asticcacaulis solisilvae]|uniref:hypothetical protein n=1 Tax=Asticcacaulis solisilvae TaxID=1217274 RepID=UPI003FD83A11
MLSDYVVLGAVFVIALSIYFFEVREDCRWMALPAALITTGLVALIQRTVPDAAAARLLIQTAVLVMVGGSIPVRYWFGVKNARRERYREHRLRTVKLVPW